MKTQLLYFVLGLLLATTSLKGQIKIGDNPQTLDPASVLELESNSRVLVITRMTTIQMENTSPLRGAVVYNTDTQCVHFYDGALWINLCDRPDEQTFTTDAIVNFSPTMIITPDANGTNFNFEVGEIRGENIVDTSINGSVDIQEGSITGLQLQDATVSFDKLAEGTSSGELLQWAGPLSGWVLIDESALTVTEIDGVIGNEIVDAADGTLVRTGLGDNANPFVLDVSVGGITNAELGADAVTSDKILNGEVDTDDIANDAITNAKMADDAIDTDEIVDDAVTADKIDLSVAGTGLNQAVDGSLEVDVTAISGDGDITSTDGTIAFVGTTTDALFEDVSFDVADNAITNAKMADDAIDTDEIVDDAVTADKIDLSVAGTGLNQAVDGSLEVDVTAISGDGDITSTDGTIAFVGTTTDALFEDVSFDVADNAITNAKMADDAIDTDEIVDDAVTADKIDLSVAGTGLNQAVDGSLEVDVTAISGDGDITSTDGTIAFVGTTTDALFEDVSFDVADNAITNAKMADDAIDTDEIVDDAVTADKIDLSVAGTGLNQAVDGSLEVDVTAISGDGDITSTDGTIAFVGTTTDALFEDVSFDVADNAITNAKMADDAIDTDEIVDDAVTADKIDLSVAGTGLNQAVDGSLEVDVTAISGDGDITSTDGTIAFVGTTTDALFEDVSFDVADNAITNAKMADDAIDTDEIVDDAVTADKIDLSVAGTGLNQAVDGSLEVDVTAISGDGDITSTDGTIAFVGTTTDALFEDVSFDVADNAITNAKMADDAIDTDEIVDDAVTTDKILNTNITPAKIEPSLTDGQVLTTVSGAAEWQSPYHAIGKVDTATPANISGASIAIIGTGNYQVVFSSNATSLDYVIQLTVLNVAANGYSIEVVTQAVDNFTVQITDSTGAAMDASWYFTVIDF
ncbi:beta strand repeat-containing protein [Allomuricauda sp. R78024]|uniref:beta strand repeat-containing protein n=1 Tax=Allomuricauda sp. R78024 TaxID=3093867 RepID=UPI0037C94236